MDHQEHRKTNWDFDDASMSLTVTALEEIQANEPIRCHYGKKSAKKFLLYYGFTPRETLEGEGKFAHLNEIELVMFVHPDVQMAKTKITMVEG
eukprot:512789-Amorphochlora_amoeboformis.AAC.1